jgi:hypothetical protein
MNSKMKRNYTAQPTKHVCSALVAVDPREPEAQEALASAKVDAG